jgi:uncharacterized protein (TIGR00297 family)
MVNREDRRKALHAATGLLALLLRDATPPFAVGLAVLLVVHNLFVLPRYAPSLMRSATPRPDPGVILYPLLVLALVLLFRDRLELAAAGWGILAFGDGLASPVGRRTRRALPWNPGKTWAGSAAFVAAGTLAGAGLLEWVAPGGMSATRALLVASLGSGLAAVLESLPVRLDDNPRVVLGAAAGLALADRVDPGLVAAAAPEWIARLPWALGASVIFAAIARMAGSVGRSGAGAGVVLATLLGTFGGAGAYAVFATFFVLGSAATRLGRDRKETRGVAQTEGGRRGASHALANGGVAVLLTVAAPMVDRGSAYLIGTCAALATAAFDTVSTEIGQAWGRWTVSPLSGRRVKPGTPGGVSPEGTVAGLGAALVVAAVAVAMHVAPAAAAGAILAGASLGAIGESVAGAIPAVRERLDGGTLNLLNTAVGAGAAMILVRVSGV